MDWPACCHRFLNMLHMNPCYPDDGPMNPVVVLHMDAAYFPDALDAHRPNHSHASEIDQESWFPMSYVFSQNLDSSSSFNEQSIHPPD